MKLALITEIPAPYRIPLWNALAERVDLRVIFLAERDPRRAYDLHRDEWRFEARVLPGRELVLGGRWLVASRGVSRELRGAEAVLVGGWNQPAFFQAARAGRVSDESRRPRLRPVPACAWRGALISL